MSIFKLDPSVFFAVLSILFALINGYLWYLLWKGPERASGLPADISIDTGALDILKERLEAETDKLSKLEDQLWGVLDKLKEMERVLIGLKETPVPASVLMPEDRGELVEIIKSWDNKGLSIIKDYLHEIEALRQSGQEISDDEHVLIGKLKEILDAIHENLNELAGEKQDSQQDE
ncbi:MAG: hypothetical protein JXJ19_03800 [Elusimicrobia bacterium]|nr:hypothetical protein [Elusimicrobiota bacterium]